MVSKAQLFTMFLLFFLTYLRSFRHTFHKIYASLEVTLLKLSDFIEIALGLISSILKNYAYLLPLMDRRKK